MLLLALVALFLEVPMAKPPEPLEEIFPLTAIILDAEVKEVKSTDPDTDPSGRDVPRQVVVLKVKRLLRGQLSDVEQKAGEVVAIKPKAPFTLKPGVKGPYLLAVDAKSGERTILGRYGPDSWTFEKLELKLAELKPAHLAR